MSFVNITGIRVLGNPAKFTDNFQFEVTFECIKELDADLEWKLTYVGSAENEECDQELDSVLVGPVPLGVNRFLFEAPPPDDTKIPKRDLLGVTVCLISCSYKGKEFIRIGYYVNNEYEDPRLLADGSNGDDGAVDIDESDGEEDDENDDENEDDGDSKKEEEEGENVDEECENGEDVAIAEGDANASSRSSLSSTGSGTGPVSLEASVAADRDGGTISSKRKGPGSQADVSQTLKNPVTIDIKQETKKLKVDQDTDNEHEPKLAPFQFPPDFSVDKIKRFILDSKPRLTRFLIDWEA